MTKEINNITIAPYGLWESPISAEKVAEGAKRILNLVVDGESIYWNESRPENKGYYTVVNNNGEDLTPSDFNVRSRVHEYGGGAFTVVENTLFCSNDLDSQLYSKEGNGSLIQFTKEEETRFAEIHPTKRGVFAIAEEHLENEEAKNFIALINPLTQKLEKVAIGYDFYTSIAISPDKKKIAYICWNHPNMPWTNTELWTADIDEMGGLANEKQVAGDVPEAIFQPRFSPNGELYFVSDREEWWNLYRLRNGKIEKVFDIDAELGWPLWQLDRSKWAFLGDKILFAYEKEGVGNLGVVDPESGKWEKIDRPGCSYLQLQQGEGFAVFIEELEDSSSQIIRMDAKTLKCDVIMQPKESAFEPSFFTKPEHIQYSSKNERIAYGYFYPPKSKTFSGPSKELPPLIVMIHGGPTSKTSPAFSLKVQYWTSRGFAIFDVDYRGSTGYGRNYRMQLEENWGVVDVEDCVFGARHLIEKKLVDPENIFIRGSSAGGFTTLAVLASDNTFKGGADYYGVADLEALAADTHKFESHYNDFLLGPYETNKKVWQKRSPINKINQFEAPLIIFQGKNDNVVPPSQSQKIYDALRKKGITTELHLYKGEGHGFRQKESIIDSLEKEALFYQNIIKAKS